MHWIDTIAICVIAAIALFPGYVLSSCCCSFSIQPLQPTLTSYRPYNNAPPSYAISLSASSKFAVNNPGGPVYLALITFPGSYVISAIPNGCVSVSINTVNCTVAGMNTLVADFARVIVADGTQPRLESVVVNGEVCMVGPSCPRYTPTNPAPTTTGSGMPAPFPSTSSNPLSSRPSSSSLSSTSLPSLPSLPSSPTSPTSLSSQPSQISSTLSSSSSTASPPTFTSSPGDTPAPEGMGSNQAKVGLIVGLSLASALLIFLACLYFLRRHRRNSQNKLSTGDSRGNSRWGAVAAAAAVAAALFGIKRKGSKLPPGRTGPNGSPNMASASEKMVPENEDPFFQPNPAHARSTSTISTTTVSEKSAAAMGVGAVLGMTLINIPETRESEDSSSSTSSSSSSASSEVNYFQGENDELERDQDAEFAEATFATAAGLAGRDNNNNNNNQQAPSSSSRHPWIALAASKSARLHRAVSAASGRLLPRHSTEASRKSLDQQEQPLTGNHTGRSTTSGPRFPKAGLFFMSKSISDRPPTRSASSMSIPRPPKSIYRPASRDISSHGHVIASIRPEHHQQMMHQQLLDDGLTPDQPLPSYTYRQLASGATTAGTAANAAALSAAVALGGAPGFFRNRNDSATSSVDSFINPGPPPLPPTRGTTRSRQASVPAIEPGTRKVYNQPIHIRPPGPHFQPDQPQDQTDSEDGFGLYGYM